MSYDDKVVRAKQIIAAHNNVAEKKVDERSFVGCLTEAGGTTEEALNLCTWEDLQKCGLPPLVAKQVAQVFRMGSDEKKSNLPLSQSRINSISVAELLEHFDPQNHDNSVGKRLNEMALSKRFLVYNNDGTINRDASAKLLNELRSGFPERDLYILGGQSRQVFRVGDSPDQYAHENPLYAGELLRPDETCDHTNRSWGGIELPLRQLIYLAVRNTKEISLNSTEDANQILDIVQVNDIEKQGTLWTRYPKAALLFNQMKCEGTLPSLRLRKSGERRMQNPFGQHKRY